MSIPKLYPPFLCLHKILQHLHSPFQRVVISQRDSLLPDFSFLYYFESCPPVVSHSSNTYCIRELVLPTLLPGCQFYSSTDLSPLGSAKEVTDCFCVDHSCHGTLFWHITGTHTVRYSIWRASRISGQFPPSSGLIKWGWLPIKKENNFLIEIYYHCVLEPVGKLLTAQHCH